MAPRWGKVPIWWVKTLRDHPNALAVAACLSAYADVDGVAWPTSETVARETGVRRDRVFAAIAHLKSAGIITKSEPQHKSGTKHHLRFAVPMNGTADNADEERRAVPINGRASATACNPDERSTVLPDGIPLNGRSSTDERLAAVPLARSAIRSGSDQQQSEIAHARDDEKEPEWVTALRASWRQGGEFNAWFDVPLLSLETAPRLALARYLAWRLRPTLDERENRELAEGKFALQLADMASDVRFADFTPSELIGAAMDTAKNATVVVDSLWKLKPSLLRGVIGARRAS